MTYTAEENERNLQYIRQDCLRLVVDSHEKNRHSTSAIIGMAADLEHYVLYGRDRNPPIVNPDVLKAFGLTGDQPETPAEAWIGDWHTMNHMPD